MISMFRVSLAGLALLFGSFDSHAAPLHDAAKKGDLALIAKLLDEGADVNKRSAIATPLYFAVQENHPDAVKLLLQRGADANGESIGGTALHSAARTGSADMVGILLEHGANANAASKDGVNALHFAAQKGHLEVVKLLLDHGADVGSVNVKGEPAIHFAMLGGHDDVAKLLVERGSKAPAVEPIGESVRTADIAHGKELSSQCLHCHIVEKGGKTKVGPPLWNLLGRDKGKFPEFQYSNAFKSAEGTWTYEDLNRLIAHPGWEYPGTAMTIDPLVKVSDRADLIGYLRTLSDEPLPLP